MDFLEASGNIFYVFPMKKNQMSRHTNRHVQWRDVRFSDTTEDTHRWKHLHRRHSTKSKKAVK